MTLLSYVELRYRRGRRPAANPTIAFMLARLLVFATAAAWTVHAAGAESGIALVLSAILTRALLTRSNGRRGAGAG